MTSCGEVRPMIGLEIHVALDTNSKLFCACPTTFGAPPNSQICPVCVGLPGALPVINRAAVRKGILASLLLQAEVAPMTWFERKHYHYPDLPKGYQISQFARPLATKGRWAASEDDRDVRIRRLHLEEDAGKSIHPVGAVVTELDFNRSGVPLVEIVTEPDLRSPGETRRFLETLGEMLKSSGVSRVRMEEGELRCDVNVNLVSDGFGQSTEKRTEISEIKNLNSFRAVEQALTFEIQRHQKAISEGDRLVHETRHWDEAAQVTRRARVKEGADDYRYLPEPDLPPIRIERQWLSEIERDLKETPRQRRERLQSEYGISSYDADVLVSEEGLADFFEAAVAKGGKPKAVVNWLMGDVLGYLNSEGMGMQDLPVTPNLLVELLALKEDGVISGPIAKSVWVEMAQTGARPQAIVEEKGLRQIRDDDALEDLIQETLSEQPEARRDFQQGRGKALGFLVGQVMKKSQGKADPKRVKALLRQQLEGGYENEDSGTK